MTRRTTTTTISLLLGILLSTSSHAETIIKQMHVITRHGARTPLGKEASNLQENNDAGSLTPYGERQMYDLGQWMADAYNSTGFFNTYVARQVHLESSGLDRTLVSANSFAAGAYPHDTRDPNDESYVPLGMRANIPVYSIDVENDVYLRAHDKCETFHQRLLDLYASDDWQDLQTQHEPLLYRLGELNSFHDETDATGKIPLTNLWNVYDELHVTRTECEPTGDGPTPTCLSLADPADRYAVSDADFQELEALTSLVEQWRYGPDTAGRLVGGPLVMKILNRMRRNAAGGFFLYSAHYATILGVLSALDKRFPLADTIPEYASALIINLQQDTVTGQEHVQVIFKPDSSLFTPPQVMKLDFCLNETVCPVDTFANQWNDWSVYEWCKECNNRNAAVCLQYLLDEQEAESLGLDKPLQTGLLIGFGVSLFLFLLFCFFCCPRNKAKKQDAMHQGPEQHRVSCNREALSLDREADTPPVTPDNNGQDNASVQSLETDEDGAPRKKPVMV